MNVSAWTDIDKEGKHYRDYFPNAKTYTLTNNKAEASGFQGYENEICLDFEKPLPKDLVQRFDVVFNHTVFERIYDVNAAFSNLCRMSRDIVILVVPFLQPMHGVYGDYWRFTPLTIKRMFEENGMSLLHLKFNNHKGASVYIFAIAAKNTSKWADNISSEFSYIDEKKHKDGKENYIGCHALPNPGQCCKAVLKKS